MNTMKVYLLLGFFYELRQSMGVDLKTKMFMSDLANNFYYGWVQNFDIPEERLYFVWHLERAWRSQSNTITKDVGIKTRI